MQKDSAQKLIQETLQSSFNKERFIYLTKNVLNHIEEAPFTYKGNLVFDDFADSIQSVERLGKYQDPEEKLIDVLIVRLKKEASLDRARTKQRNFVAKYLKGSRGGVLKDAALVAFVSPNEDDWRFSLVKMEYKFNEKGKVEEEFTPARRYSFLVGKHENSHTAQSRLLPLLLNDEVNPTLKELEDVFSVEKVTKEFFEKYRELFLKLKESLDEITKKDKKVKEDFKAKDVNTIDFTKKLLGQIVFLYFLQKKGWFGVERNKEWGSGSKRFLRELFEKKHGNYKNFFNEILEPLFYEALRLERTGDYYSRFDCRIPFLNGGLFDPLNDYDWVDTEIELPNEIFSNEIKDAKTGDVGTGILDVFDRYNFTVKEDEPLEKEVAVDPEMLGKVFENLLEVKDRKSKGTYYTPREIVHYMCQESLANYLATELEGKASKEDIETLIKYGESVVEHDSRVVSEGRETGRYSFKLPQSVRKHAKEIDDKLASIRVCDPAVGSGAFPVGMMNEVIRTRNALTAYIGKNGDRTPYNFKRHAIQNCLYGVDIDTGAVEIAKLRLWLSLIVDEEERGTIQPLPNLDYKIVQGNSLSSVEQNLFNQPLFTKLEELKPLFFNETNARKKQEYKKQIDNLISQITNNNQSFDFEIYFSEVFHDKKGFDVVIANPPYVSYYSRESAKTESTIKVLTILREKFDFTKYERKTGRLNLWMFFVEKFVKLLRINGVSAFIVDVNFTKDLAKNIRRYLLENISIKQFVHDLSEFEYVASGQVILLVQKDDDVSHNKIILKGSLLDPGVQIQQSGIGAPDYSLVVPVTDPVISKLLKETKLGELKQIQLTTGVQVSGIETYKSKGVKDYFYRANWDYKNVFPAVDPKSVRRYSKPRLERGIVFDYKLASKITEATEKSAVVLNKYKGFLNVEKVLIRQSASEILATIAPPKTCGEYSLFSLINNGKDLDIKYLLSLLNSKLYTYFSRKSGIILMKKGTQPQIRKNGLEKLPIKKIVPSGQKSFIDLVNKIFAVTKDDDYLENSTKQAKARDYEKQIDQLVYKLYGLTPEEIKIIENER